METNQDILSLPVSRFVLNGFNARKFEPNSSFTELVESVRLHGVIQPILARPVNGGDQYEVIAGERRLRACRQIAETDGKEVMVPAVIRKVDDNEAWDLMLIENLEREDLSPYEEATAFQNYVAKHGDSPDTIAELAQRTSVSPARIRSRLTLLKMPEPVVTSWANKEITTAHIDELTRIEDEKGILSAYTEIIKGKLTVNELKDYLRSQAPELAMAFFKKEECQSCPSNASIQCKLFDADGSGKCMNSACFERKQGEFFTVNWVKSKVRATFLTNGYRFQHNVAASQRNAIQTDKVAERCLECPEFISLIKLVGRTVQGFERCCVGNKECYTELYVPKKPVKEKKTTAAAAKAETHPPKTETQTKPNQERGSQKDTMDSRRATTHREDFYKTAIPVAIAGLDQNSAAALRLAITAVAIADFSAREALGEATKDNIVKTVANLSDEELPQLLVNLANCVIMKSTGSSAEIRDNVAEMLLGIDISQEWSLTPEYLKALTKSEIVTVGEELGLWELPEIKAQKNRLYPKKGLMALKNGELSDLLLKSGADIRGKTPREIREAGRRGK